MKYLLTILSVLAVSVSVCGAQFLQTQQRDPVPGKSTSVVTIDGVSYYVHTVVKGETFYSISKLYDVPIKAITENNPHVVDGLREGHVIKVPFENTQLDKMSKRKQARLFETHIVAQGETLFSISRRYEIPVNTLIEDNEGLDPAHLSIGQTINIRKKSVGEASPEQIKDQLEEYKDALNSVSADYEFHLVQPGETLYSLSRQYGVTEQSLVELNNITDGLKAGALIKVRPKNVEPEHFEAVADSLHEVDRAVEDSLLRTTLTVKEFAEGKPVEVALMLPLGGEDLAAGANFLEFYQGALLGLEDLKSQGIATKVSLYNTARSTDEVRRIVGSQDFGYPDIIIGPVYEDNMRPALDYAQQNRVVMVSPLAALENTQSPVLYQMSPDASAKYEKMKPFFTPEKRVVFVTTVNRDFEFEKFVKPLLPTGYKQVDYNATLRMEKGVFESVIDPKAENLIVVSCTNELVADQILAAISSVHSNLVARSQMPGSVTVLAGSGWGRFDKEIDKSLFFKLGVCYPAMYHFDRGDARVSDFDRRFVSSFGRLPSPYAYRGYDAVKLFVSAVKGEGATFTDKVNGSRQTLLQMPYGFGQKEQGGTFVNMQWGLVCYGSDYSITVK